MNFRFKVGWEISSFKEVVASSVVGCLLSDTKGGLFSLWGYSVETFYAEFVITKFPWSLSSALGPYIGMGFGFIHCSEKSIVWKMFLNENAHWNCCTGSPSS